jgi:hypothetical protein
MYLKELKEINKTAYVRLIELCSEFENGKFI